MNRKAKRLNKSFLVLLLWLAIYSLVQAANPLAFSNEAIIELPKPYKPAQLSLSQYEQQWLAQHRQIRFAGDPNWLPYEGFDEQGNYIGIVSDYLKIIEQQLGISFDIIQTSTWLETVAKARAGELDVISETTDSSLNSFLNFSMAYVASRVVIVMDKDAHYVENISQISDKKIAIIKEYGYLPQIIKAYPHLQYVEVNNIQEGLNAVLTGRVDALFATASQVTYHIAEQGYNSLRIVGTTEFKTELALGVSDEFKPLVALINKALATVEQKDKSRIVSTWVWGEQSYITKLNQRLIYQISSVFLVVILFSFYWNRKLSKEIVLRKEMENQNQLLLDNIPLSVVVSHLDGSLISVNPQGADGYVDPNADIKTLKSADFYSHAAERDEVKAAVLRDGSIHQKIVSFKKLDGSHRSMLVSVMPIQYQRKAALLSIGLDLTERLQMEQDLQHAKTNAEQSNRAKSAFLANMSHEIRTPMNAILGFTELLHEQVKDPKLQTFVKTIRSAGNALLMLINDILDVSKIEAGKLSIHVEPTNPHEIFDDISNMFYMAVKNKNLDLIVDIKANMPSCLCLDSARLRQVLFNIVGNAVKFTKQGYVKIEVNTDVTNGIDTVGLRIVVSDSGIGIVEESIESIFEHFHQQEGQNVREYGGTGLGLTISKRLTELMGGTLSVESTLGVGSGFTINLHNVKVCEAPQSLAVGKADTPTAGVVFDAANILIVDDIEDNRHLLRETFLNLGLCTDQAENGLQAVAMVAENCYDLVMMDIRMPIMDGYEAAQRIKAQYPELAIIALTASVMRDDYERERREYFDAYLRKPALQKDLVAVLKSYLPHHHDDIDTGNLSAPVTATLVFSEVQKLVLAETFLERLIQLQKTNNINDINDFAQALSEHKLFVGEQILQSWATQLLYACDAFDVATIKRLLGRLLKALT